MAQPRILKIERTDADANPPYVLLEATARGSKPLDLIIVATEGEAKYTVTLKHDRVSSLRVKSCPASEQEWQTILQRMFNQETQHEIQTSATVESEASVSIVIRKQIQGITQRLGGLTLNRAKDDEINVLDWCANTVDALVEHKHKATESTAKVQELESTVADLKKQLEELVQAKDDDETTLLFKFKDLLNEKKVKIREQQKIMATMSQNADMGVAAEPSLAVSEPAEPPSKGNQSSTAKKGKVATSKGRKAGPSRAVKRKASASAAEAELSSDENADKMDVDSKIKTEPDETDEGETTDRTASTASDEDEESGVAGADKAQEARKGAPATKRTDAPPPARSLPFTNRSKPKATAAPTAAAGSETESDDEL